MKRSVILTLCIILCLALTLGGTIAYLSDFDGDVNVMTLGQVKIEVVESQRNGDELEDFDDNKPLYPLVGEIDQWDDQYGMPTNPLFVDKIVQVNSNSRNAGAHLRVYIGVPTAVLNVGHTGQDAVHLLWGKDSTSVTNWPWEEDAAQNREVTIDGILYTMLCYNYTKLLEPGEITEPLLTGLYLDKRVDNSDNPADGYTMWVDGVEYPIDCKLSNGLQVTVLAQAVQADGFDSAAQAFEESGMNDVDFDKELNLKISVVLEAAVQKLVDLLNNQLGADREPYEPLVLELESTSYTLNADAVAALNDAALQADHGTEVQLRVDDEQEVTIHLTDAPLADNISIVNDGGSLTLIGPDADQ